MPATAKVVDMSKVKERGDFRPKQMPEGDYPAKVTKVVDHKSKAGNMQWLYTITLTGGAGKGATYPYYCGQGPDELWKVRNLFISAGLNVPKKKVKLDPNRVVGKSIGVTLEDDEYQGKLKSVIANVLPLSEIGDADEDADEDDEEAEVEVEVEVDADDDEEEEEDEEPPPPPKKATKAERAKARKAKAKAAPVEDDEDDEDLEELEIDDL